MPEVTDLPSLAVPDDADLVHCVDVSDISGSPEGTSKNTTLAAIRGSAVTALVKVQVSTITNPGTGLFEWTGLDSTGIKNYYLEGKVLSDRTGSTVDACNLDLNSSGSESDYHNQNNAAVGGNPIVTENLDAAEFLVVATADSAVNEPTPIEARIYQPDSANAKFCTSIHTIQTQSNEVRGGYKHLVTPITAPVTSIRITPNAGANLSGYLTLYAEKEMTVYVK